MPFQVYSVRLDFKARNPVRFPAGKPGNILRGAFGNVFRRLVCDPECTDVRTCQRSETCPYARIFEPSARGTGPSGLTDWPRPFVFRAGHLDGTTVQTGDTFHFNLNVFEMRNPVLQFFVKAFALIAREGLGQERGQADLEAVYKLDENSSQIKQIYSGGSEEIQDPAPPIAFDLNPGPDKVKRLRVRFTTATELKSGKTLAERPDFHILFGRARDRVSTLQSLYQSGPPRIDFKGMGQRAGAVRMTRCEVRWRDITRRSSRTGQIHPLGGFVGEADYEGDLAEFVPFLRAAQWTGVGRHTVWGKGFILISVL